MGAQLSRLIAEGKRALGQEVVLPSDPSGPSAAEEQDDEPDAWEDEQPRHPHHPHTSLSSSYRSVSHLRPTSPFLNTPPRSPLHPHSVPALQTPVSMRSMTEDDETALSPDLQEVMARARAARRRNGM